MGTSTWSTYPCNQSSASRSKVIMHLADPSLPECITALRIRNGPDVLLTATNGVMSRTHEPWHPVPSLERWSPAHGAHLSAPPIRGGENHALMCDRVPSFGPSSTPRSGRSTSAQTPRRDPGVPPRPRCSAPRDRPRGTERQDQAMVPGRRKAHFHIGVVYRPAGAAGTAPARRARRARKRKAPAGGVPAERPSRVEAATSCSRPPTTSGWCGGPECTPRCPSPSP